MVLCFRSLFLEYYGCGPLTLFAIIPGWRNGSWFSFICWVSRKMFYPITCTDPVLLPTILKQFGGCDLCHNINPNKLQLHFKWWSPSCIIFKIPSNSTFGSAGKIKSLSQASLPLPDIYTNLLNSLLSKSSHFLTSHKGCMAVSLVGLSLTSPDSWTKVGLSHSTCAGVYRESE